MKNIILKFILLSLTILLFSCSHNENVENMVNSSVNLSEVYVAGKKNSQACYWNNNQLIMLDSGSLTNTFADKIIVTNENVHVFGGGYENNQFISLYWKNGVLTNLKNQLSTNAYSVSITDMNVVGNDVYFAGYTYANPFNYNNSSSLVYWKNNVKNTVANYSNHSFTKTKIQVVNNNVYLLGAGNVNFSDKGFYKNGVYNEILNVDLYDIIINKNNNEVYVLGSNYSNNSAYYKNLTNNTSVYLPNSLLIEINFDEINNMYLGFGNKIFKNGTVFFDGSANINNQSYVFKFLNDNTYKLTIFENNDVAPANYSLNINGINSMQSASGEVFRSFFVVQN